MFVIVGPQRAAPLPVRGPLGQLPQQGVTACWEGLDGGGLEEQGAKVSVLANRRNVTTSLFCDFELYMSHLLSGSNLLQLTFIINKVRTEMSALDIDVTFETELKGGANGNSVGDAAVGPTFN